MNLMYFKNLRGDRDGGTTGLLSSSRRATAGIDGGGASSGPSYGGVRGLGVGAGGGANSRSWFNAGVAGGVSSLSRTPGPGSGGPALLGTAAASATGAGAGGAGLTEMQHLRTHPLGLFDLPRHGTDNGSGGFDDPDRGSGLSRSSLAGGGSATASSTNNRWSHGGGGGGGGVGGLDRLDTSCVVGSGVGVGGGGGSRADYRYTRVDRQPRMVDSALDSSGGVAGGSRSVRSGLYAGEHQFTGEVCLSVSGLSGNASRGGAVVSGRTGKQVSFGRHSPDVSGLNNSGGTMERERSRESEKRLSRSGGGPGLGSSASGNNGGGGGGGNNSVGGVLSNKENSESRSTFPRSSIVASKRPSPERLLSSDPRDSRRPSSRDDSADGRRRRPNSGTAETSLSLPDSRQQHRGGSGRRSNDPRDVHRISNDPTFDELIDPKDLNLNDIARDCFIIPVHLVNRFLPLGVTVSLAAVEQPLSTL